MRTQAWEVAAVGGIRGEKMKMGAQDSADHADE
jgi:hypothetical protein